MERQPRGSARRHISRWHVYGVVVVLLIASALRFSGITRVGIQFEDEAAYAADARLWYRCARVLTDPEAIRAGLASDKVRFRKRMDEAGVDFTDRYIKPSQGYTFLGALTMFVVGDRPAALLALNALCGTLAVLVLYLLGRILFNPTTGLAAAFLLAVSPYHLFYSRGAFAESSAGLFCLTGVLLWTLGRQRNWSAWRTYGYSGLAIGYAITCHYRYGYVALVLLLLDGLIGSRSVHVAQSSRRALRRLTARWSWFIAGMAIPALAFEAMFRCAQFVALLADAWFPVPSFLEGAWMWTHAIESFGLSDDGGRMLDIHVKTIVAFADYFLHWHGAAACAAVLLGAAVVLHAKRDAKLVACMVIATFCLLLCQPILVARALATALPFLALCMGVAVAWVGAKTARRLSTPAPLPTLVLAVLVALPSLPGLRHLYTRRSQLTDLCSWLAAHEEGTVVVAEDPLKYQLYLEGSPIEVISGRRWRSSGTPEEALAKLREENVRWVIVDPQRWHYRDPHSARRTAVFHWWQSFEEVLAKEGPPIATFEHLRNSRWEFLAEGPGLDYLEEMTKRNDGAFKVFELRSRTPSIQVSAHLKVRCPSCYNEQEGHVCASRGITSHDRPVWDDRYVAPVERLRWRHPR